MKRRNPTSTHTKRAPKQRGGKSTPVAKGWTYQKTWDGCEGYAWLICVDGKRFAWAGGERSAKAICDKANAQEPTEAEKEIIDIGLRAAITKRQQPSQTDEEIAREAAVELRYRRNLGPLTPYTDIELSTKVILAALRAKSSSVSGLRMFHKWASNELETQARTILELVAKSEKEEK